MQEIWVLRLGHRPQRDKRVTTHVALTARALGARGVVVSTKDPDLEENIRDVVSRFGGEFEVRTGVGWRAFLRDFRGQIVHLTMYGIHIDDALSRIGQGRVCVVVGAEKVPAEVYQMADVNLAVGNQPHSEVAALGILLDRITEGEGLRRDFGGRMRILPMDGGKRVENDPK
jgi:tRNA (cytidine56-2'-O)-methyltransferase